MTQAIAFLESREIKVDNNGNILSNIPDGQEGISLIDELENITMSAGYCYTIIDNKIEKIDY